MNLIVDNSLLVHLCQSSLAKRFNFEKDPTLHVNGNLFLKMLETQLRVQFHSIMVCGSYINCVWKFDDHAQVRVFHTSQFSERTETDHVKSEIDRIRSKCVDEKIVIFSSHVASDDANVLNFELDPEQIFQFCHYRPPFCSQAVLFKHVQYEFMFHLTCPRTSIEVLRKHVQIEAPCYIVNSNRKSHIFVPLFTTKEELEKRLHGTRIRINSLISRRMCTQKL